MKTLALLPLCCLLAGLSTAAAAPIPNGAIYTNKARFRIPFHYDNDELKRLGAKEIRLIVSRDRGRTWQPSQTVAPDAGKFNFQAANDGEYWFNVRTLDSKNRLHPEGGANEVGLQVVVDTTPPKLQLVLRSPAPGQVLLSWAAADDHLDPTQLRLEYIQPGSKDWQSVSVVPKATGQQEWTVPQGGRVAVRGSIADLAKNTTSDQVEVTVAASQSGVPRPRQPDLRQPVAGKEPPARDETALTLPEQFPGPSRGKSSTTPDTSKFPQTADDGARFKPMRSAETAAAPQIRNSLTSHHGSEPKVKSPDEAPAPAKSAPPANSHRRVVKSRKFQIGYRLQDVAPADIATVELYASPDHGATWFHYQSDPDKQSPVDVEVRDPGTYGFILGIRTKQGTGSDLPQNGDAPSLEVVVDETAPTIELLPLEQGRGRHAEKIRISWRYTDDFPAEKPVSIYYSATGDAPWVPVCDWTENRGSYIWTIGSETPQKFYVRLEARDQAGNTQTAETKQHVVVDVSRPTAKIIDVESGAPAVVPKN